MIDIKTGAINSMALPARDYPQFAFSADLKQMASKEFVKGVGYSVHLWQLPEGKDMKTIDLGKPSHGHTPEPSGLAYSPDGKLLAISGFYGGQIYDLAADKFVGPMPEYGQAVAFSPDSSKILCKTMTDMSSPQNFWLVDPQSGKSTPIYGTVEEFPSGLGWSGNKTFFYFGSDVIHFFDVH